VERQAMEGRLVQMLKRHLCGETEIKVLGMVFDCMGKIVREP
jgi:hypothetical protein